MYEVYAHAVIADRLREAADHRRTTGERGARRRRPRDLRTRRYRRARR